ncbi:TetR family transcriptional regulator [Nocardia sp. NPDC005998]|uniref:TetR/AcrR family transcriptional regulator n=1 Tax=Nocardia sp. NPDC005998 TaxID=3156894 RepID=UPI0033BB6017
MPAGRTRPGNRRELIVTAAAELFARNGFHEVSMGQVAGAVGISAPALYRHFRDKRDLLTQVVADAFAALEAAVPADVDTDGALRSLAELVAQRRDIGALWQREARHLPEAARAQTRDRLRRLNARMTGILRIERPTLDQATADLLVWSVSGVLASPASHRVAMPANRMADLLHAMGHAVLSATVTAGEPADVGGGARVSRASRREHLVSAATELFNRRGYLEVGIDDIGLAAGIAGPSVYKHFASKHELLYTALNRGAEVLQFGLGRAVANSSSPAAALVNVLRSYVDLSVQHPDLVGALVTEVDHLPAEQRHAIRQAQHDYVAEWVHLLASVRPELSRPTAAIAVHGVFGLVNSVVRVGHLRARPSLGGDLIQLGQRLLAAPR